MSNKDLFDKVREMQLPIGQYALFGSAPLGIRGLKECHDIDIIMTEDLWNKFKEDGWEVKSLEEHQYLSRGEIEIWKDWGPLEWDVLALIEDVEVIDGLPFVKLEHVIKWKKALGREKDLKDVELVEKFLENLK